MNKTHIFQFETAGQAYHSLFHRLLTDNYGRGLVNQTFRRTVRCENLICEIEQPTELHMSLADVGFKPARWDKFLKNYFDTAQFPRFYQRVLNDTVGNCISYLTINGAGHRSGGCLLGLTIRTIPDVHVVLHSRTTTLAPTGLLDLTFLALLCRQLSVDTGKPVTASWHIDQMQGSTLKSVSFLPASGQLELLLRGEYDHTYFGKQLHKEVLDLDRQAATSKYMSHRRYAEKFKELSTTEVQPFDVKLPDSLLYIGLDRMAGDVTVHQMAQYVGLPDDVDPFATHHPLLQRMKANGDEGKPMPLECTAAQSLMSYWLYKQSKHGAG
jgi:hypothetical protein